jgi:hypothetical protein
MPRFDAEGRELVINYTPSEIARIEADQMIQTLTFNRSRLRPGGAERELLAANAIDSIGATMPGWTSDTSADPLKDEDDEVGQGDRPPDAGSLKRRQAQQNRRPMVNDDEDDDDQDDDEDDDDDAVDLEENDSTGFAQGSNATAFGTLGYGQAGGRGTADEYERHPDLHRTRSGPVDGAAGDDDRTDLDMHLVAGGMGGIQAGRGNEPSDIGAGFGRGDVSGHVGKRYRSPHGKNRGGSPTAQGGASGLPANNRALPVPDHGEGMGDFSRDILKPGGDRR